MLTHLNRSGPSHLCRKDQDVIRCGHCGNDTSGSRDNLPWCPYCSIWLVSWGLTGEWTSFAAVDQRRRRAAGERQATVADAVVRAALPAAQALLPEGWRAALDSGGTQACTLLSIRPIPGLVEAVAYLAPPRAGRGWYVRISNRTERISFPLYCSGGARVAYFDTIAAAVTAAVDRLRIEQVHRH